MHRQAAIAILAAAVLVPGLQAQMRSGGVRGSAPARGWSGMGARGGFAPGRGAMPAGRHFGGAPGFHGGSGFRGGVGFGNRRFSHPRRGFFFNNGCFNGFCNFGYAGYPAYYYAPPIFWSGLDNGPDYGMQTYATAPAAPAYPAYDDSALQVQIQHLTDEVEQLRQEERDRAARAAAPARPNRMDLPTVLVFRDGRVKEVQNYGIVGQTLWIFDEQRARKVPLADLDLAATKGANDDRGGFVLPEGR